MRLNIISTFRFMEFMSEVVIRSRGGGQESKFEYDAVSLFM